MEASRGRGRHSMFRREYEKSGPDSQGGVSCRLACPSPYSVCRMPLYALNLAERSADAYRDYYPILKRSGDVPCGLLLQRYRIGLILRRLLIQQGDEFAARSRDADLAFADNLLSTEASAIELFVRTAVRPKRRALQRNAGEQAAGARIAEDFCPHHDVGISRCCTPLRPNCCRGIGAKLHFAAQD